MLWSVCEADEKDSDIPASGFIRVDQLPRFAFILIILLAFAYKSGFAQINLATLRGTITDASGATVSGATVVVTEVATNVEARRVVTDSNGDYEVPDVQPGTYRVSAEKPGFQTFVANAVLIDPGQVRRVDMKLEVGNVAQTVSVNAGAALIETETGTISRQLDTTTYATGATVDINPSPLGLLIATPGMQGNGWNMVMSGMSGGSEQTWEADGVAADISSGGSASAIAQLDDTNFFETVEATTVNAGVDASRPVGFNLSINVTVHPSACLSRRRWGRPGLGGQEMKVRGTSQGETPASSLVFLA